MNIETRFTKAWDLLNSRPVDVQSLPKSRNGQNCKCICIECKQPLEACQGLIRMWYFRHQAKTNCSGGPMTAIHLMAQHLLIGSHIMQTNSGSVLYENGTIEYQIPGSNYKVDVVGMKVTGEILAIEIFVNHQVDEVKAEFFKEHKIHSLEIDISNVDLDIKSSDLLYILLNDIKRQRIIFDPSASQPVQQKQERQFQGPTPNRWYENPVTIVFGAIAGLIFLLWPRKKSKSRK